MFPKEESLRTYSFTFSIKAINASRDNNSSLLLVVTQKDASIEVPTSKDINEIGTLCRITSYSNMKTFIRVHINIKKVENETNIKEQELIKFNRSGYTAVEWGGSEIK